MLMRTILTMFLLVGLIAMPSLAAGEGPVRVEAEGTVLLGEDATVGQARAAALNNARRSALERATGVEVRGVSTVYNYRLITDLVQTATRGIIVKENVLESRCATEGEQISCTARIEAWVQPLRTERRGNFAIRKAAVMRAGRTEAATSPVFQSGDELVIRVSANQDAWLHLFSVNENGGIGKLYPNEYLKAGRLPAGTELLFPDEACRQGGLKIVVRTPRGKKKAVESVLVIATKENRPLLEGRKDRDLTITDLMKELSELDPSQWVEQTVGYEVRE